ncbi:MAG: TonB-dependent receptor plug domain-containing protein [Phenylobacterium sp.]|uniref:TonB-dependent receptor plug domain-containing protein n=1 Tax=Phenylobacterium sp. TaxID=1871053 RepID=UPI0025E2DDC0|nr:TonB-dependent receptor plug domain-containing protein [Phenylobacterium sp.]MBI1198613.1 TonB-dependent receptor plug domain-containing protein [Phenylobacterium sp.]
MTGLRVAGLWGSTAAAALMMMAAPVAAQAQTQTFKFDLPAQSLGGALRAFGQTSRQQIIFAEDDVRGKTSPALQGSFTADEGLNRLLAGSGLSVRRTAAGVLYVGREPAPSATASGAPASSDLTEVQVTGSRIRRTDTSSASPVTMVTADDLTERGFTQVGDMLNQLTSNTPSFAQPPFSGIPAGSGQTFPNLLNLGAGRTLTLINGRRMVATSSDNFGSRGVDVNIIPAGLIERIDVVQAGGAAVYGSDAIGGVVNYILKDHFEGLTADVQYGISSHGDDPRPAARVTFGKNFAGGRGNIAADIEYSKTDPLLEADREFFKSGVRSVTNLANTSLTDGQPPTALILNGHLWRYNSNGVIFTTNTTSPTGLLRDGAGQALQFSPDGSSVIPYDTGVIGPNSSSASGGDGLDARRLSTLATGVKRYTGTLVGHYDLTDRIRASSEFLYSREVGDDEIGTQGMVKFVGGFAPGGQGPVSFTRTNPFLTPAQIATLSAASPTFAAGGPLVLSKMYNVIPQNRTTKTDVWRLVGALDGDFTLADRDFYWSVSASHGETKSHQTVLDFDLAKSAKSFSAARNAAGQIVCAVNADAITTNDDPACVPFNPFINGGNDAAVAYFAVPVGGSTRNKQDDILLTLGGDIVTLPAGKAKFSVAYEHRAESARFDPSAANLSGITGQGQSFAERGKYNTDEFSGELLVPLVGGDFTLPLIEALDVSGSYRHVDNSLAGKEEVWGVGGNWTIGWGLGLRVSRSRNFSAPTLGQQFAPTSVNPGNPAQDPCDRTLINGGPNPAVRLANCQALFAAHPEYGPLASFNDPAINTGLVALTVGGNPNLKNEVSKTWTYGLVYAPRYVPGLTLSADRIEIDLTNGLSSFTINNFLSVCYDTQPQQTSFCDTFTRDSRGFLQTGRETTFNAGSVLYRGEIYNFSYRFPIGRFFGDADLGSLEVAAEATHTSRQETSVTGFDLTRSQDTPSAPDWRIRYDLRYSKGPLKLFYSLYYLPSVRANATATIESTPVPVIKANYQHTISAQYDLGNNITIRGGVVNLTDEGPSFNSRIYGDLYGRRYFLGVTARY